MQRWMCFALLALLPSGRLHAAAAPVLRPFVPAGKLQSLRIEAATSAPFTLAGRDAAHQLLVTGSYDSGQVRDLTRDVSFRAAPEGVVRIEGGLVVPLKDGRVTITATADEGPSATTTLVLTHQTEDVGTHFGNEVVPLFTRFGCNAGGCHGKATGQNGFRLSLLGFEPEEDYEFLVKEGRGRRLFPSAPERSLLLIKATGQVSHGGGRKIEVDSPAYRLLLRWVAQGAPFGKPDDPVVKSIEVQPKARVLARGTTQQLRVLAHFTDGSARDVTRLAQFELNQPDLADLSDSGLLGLRGVPGIVTVMARFSSHVDVFRATVPLGAPVEELPAGKGFVDQLVHAQLKRLGLPPSPRADDGTFLRRATIDLAGRLPTVEEVKAFLADRAPDKRAKLVDRLLASDDHADYFANKWASLLRNRRASADQSPAPTRAFHAWVRESIHDNKPYDQFVRDVLTATGEEVKVPPVVWFRELKEPAAMTEDAAQLFLGQRIGCAKCHHHPMEKWSQQDYWGLTAFFSRVQVKVPPPVKGGKKEKGAKAPPRIATVEHQPGVAEATNPRTNKAVPPTSLGGRPLALAKGVDPRQALVEWMTARDNPYFARTMANRTWKHFLGRGLVDPEDDMRATNPPSNPELLDALARYFADNDYDVKKLVRLICTSQVYRLSAVPNVYNAGDSQSFSRFLPRRLHAEVLLDAIDDVTQSRTVFAGSPAGTRAVQLPDNVVESYFLSVLGRPDASSACECERSGEASLAAALHLMNSKEVLAKVGGARARALAADRRPHAEKVRELYLIALSRPPSREEEAVLLEHLADKGGGLAAYEDVLWALLNTREFQFNH